jgi:ATP/maltotriose-dependent transcriptional regulator MalT
MSMVCSRQAPIRLCGQAHKAASVSIEVGRAALADGRWREARGIFEGLLEAGESPEALEGLGLAARWELDEPAAMRAHQRAYRLYRARGDHRGAARMAIQIALGALNFHSDVAVARGWMERARRLLAEVPEASSEAGWLRMGEAHLALTVDHDLAGALRLAAEAIAIGREVADLDVEMFGIAVKGLALVTEGRVDEGMRLLDEAAAAATAGELADVDVLQTVYCYLIYACKRVRDFDRAASWCARVRQSAERWSDRLTFSICRVHYADVLLWRGAWADCEAELDSAEREFRSLNERRVGDVVARLGELRRRQGRVEEAEGLFQRAASHPVSVVGRAALAIDRGDAESATELVERYLRRIGPGERTERIAALELLVRARVLAGDIEAAEAARDELRETADIVGGDTVRAIAATAEGLTAGARGDHDAARRSFEDAADLFDRVAPYEAAAARLDLARALRALGRHERAREEEAAAEAALTRLGSAARTASVHGEDATGLTRREQEVLRLVARGLSNQEIARELVLSVRTVERHISNIYDKIGAAGRSARAAAASYAATAGLT